MRSDVDRVWRQFFANSVAVKGPSPDLHRVAGAQYGPG